MAWWSLLDGSGSFDWVSLTRVGGRTRSLDASQGAIPEIGTQVRRFPRLTGVDGTASSDELFGGPGITVVAFLSTGCPAVKACLGELVSLYRRYQPRGVRIVGVNSNNPYLSPTDSLAEMARWAAQVSLPFPYLKDPEQELARALGATNTPQFVVLDSDRRIRYRGRMFDSREPTRATSRDLEVAVVALLEGHAVLVSSTAALGCSIVP